MAESPESIQKAAADLSNALQQLYKNPGVIQQDTLTKLEAAGKEMGHALAQQEGELPTTPRSPKPPAPCSVQGTALPVDPEGLKKMMQELHEEAPSEVTGGQCCCDEVAAARGECGPGKVTEG